MKTSAIFVILAAFSTAVAGSPTVSGLEAREAEAEAAGLLPRACPGKRSGCSIDWRRKCEHFCENESSGKFLVMESCVLGWSRCCCDKF